MLGQSSTPATALVLLLATFSIMSFNPVMVPFAAIVALSQATHAVPLPPTRSASVPSVAQDTPGTPSAGHRAVEYTKLL